MKNVIKNWIAELKLNRELLKVSPSAIKEYKTEVRGMEFLPKRLVRKKLTRNVEYVKRMIGSEYEKDGIIVYTYGNMKIFVQNNTVVTLTNRKGKGSTRGFVKNEKVYKELSAKYRIDV